MMKAVPCSNLLCDQRESLLRQWLQPVVRQGVYWERQWYCSRECLEGAILPVIQRFWEGSEQEPLDIRKSRLGYILVEKGVITKDQLEAALGKQAQQGDSTGEWLTRLKFVSSRELTATLSQQLGFPWIDEIKPDLSGNLLDRVPKRLYLELRMLPLEYNKTAGSLVVVTAANNPVSVVHMLRKMLDCSVHAFLASDDNIEKGLRKFLRAHKDSSSKILHFETARPREILGEVVSRLGEFGARELRIESLGQSLWCRYVRRGHWFDLFIERSQEKFAGTIGQEVPTAIVEA